MRKLTILGLSLLLILGLTACDLNIFTSLENIPTFSAAELNSDVEDVSNDDGEIDGAQAVTKDETTGVVTIDAGVETYIDNVVSMIDNDSLTGLSDEESDTVARNLDTVVESVLSSYDIDLSDSDESESGDPPESFEDMVIASLSGSDLSDDQKQEEATRIREIVQKSANAAVAVRLEADPDSRDLVSNTTLLLLDLLGSDESRSIARELTYDREYDIPENIQIRLVADDASEYVIKLEPFTTTDSQEQMKLYFEQVISGTDYSAVVGDTSTDGSGYVIPVGEQLELEESPDPVDEQLAAFLGLIEGMVAADGVGIPYLRAESRLQVLEDFMADDEEGSEGGEDTGGDDQSISGLFTMLEDNNIDITKLNKIATTFNGIAKSSRAFATTLEYTDETETEIDLDSIAPMFKERTGNALNGDGLDMVTMSVLSIVFDYLFEVDENDNRGLLDAAAFHGFLNDDDLLAFSDLIENGENDYSILRIKRIPELLPELLAYSPSSSNALNPDDEEVMDELMNNILENAGIMKAGSDPMEASVRLSRDAARLDKLALLISLDVSSMTDGEAATFEELIENMFADDSAGGVE